LKSLSKSFKLCLYSFVRLLNHSLNSIYIGCASSEKDFIASHILLNPALILSNISCQKALVIQSFNTCHNVSLAPATKFFHSFNHHTIILTKLGIHWSAVAQAHFFVGDLNHI
jgi:hypothetical protein